MAASKPTPIEAGSKDAKAKDAALKAAVTQIERDFGAGSVMRLGSDNTMDVEAIPTGALSLDLALDLGDGRLQRGVLGLRVLGAGLDRGGLACCHLSHHLFCQPPSDGKSRAARHVY